MSIIRSTSVRNNNATSPDKRRVPPSGKDTQDFNRILEADEEHERRQPRQADTLFEQAKSTKKQPGHSSTMNSSDPHNNKRPSSRGNDHGNGNTFDNHPNIRSPERPIPDNIGNVAEVDVSIQIEQLVDEKERGIISADEFARRKAALLKRR